MKYISIILSVLIIAFVLSGCTAINGDAVPSTTEETASHNEAVLSDETNTTSGNEFTETIPNNDTKVLVAYFSATGNTKGVAEKITEAANADIYEIVPQIPYTSDDLDYNTDCRANKEQNDDSARPEISGTVENMDKYDIVFIGYPIWWGQAPKIMYTFLESYDFNGKTIIPFCTSGSSSIGSSTESMHSLTNGTDWLEGQRFDGNASENEIKEWIDSLGLTSAE